MQETTNGMWNTQLCGICTKIFTFSLILVPFCFATHWRKQAQLRSLRLQEECLQQGGRSQANSRRDCCPYSPNQKFFHLFYFLADFPAVSCGRTSSVAGNGNRKIIPQIPLVFCFSECVLAGPSGVLKPWFGLN